MKRTMIHRRLGVLALLVCAIGCNGSDLAVVKGKVTYNGAPVGSGTIMFAAADKPAAYGDLKSDGTYELMTEKPGDGAAPGSYQVTVVAMQDQKDMLPEERSPLPAPIVPTIYTSLATTPLTAEVKSGENEINFDLEGKLGK